MNSVNLIGRLTKEIEVNATPKGTLVTNFSLAVQKDKENADFINCVAYNKTAELLQKFVKKGNQVAVEGSISTRNYEGKDGKKVYVTEVIVNKIHLLSNNISSSKSNNPMGHTMLLENAEGELFEEICDMDNFLPLKIVVEGVVIDELNRLYY
jgi:single-strand DNA-binding protein